MKRTSRNICPLCDAGDPTSVITECDCQPTGSDLHQYFAEHRIGNFAKAARHQRFAYNAQTEQE